MATEGEKYADGKRQKVWKCDRDILTPVLLPSPGKIPMLDWKLRELLTQRPRVSSAEVASWWVCSTSRIGFAVQCRPGGPDLGAMMDLPIFLINLKNNPGLLHDELQLSGSKSCIFFRITSHSKDFDDEVGGLPGL